MSKQVSIVSLFLSLLLSPVTVLAGPKSDNFELQEYSFGSANTGPSFSSSGLSLFGNTETFNSDKISSTAFQALPGLVFQHQSAVPPAPLFENTNNTLYNKLHLTVVYNISYSSIPSDISFAIAVSTDFANPTLTRYIQADHTLGTNPVWQSYTTWGGSSGFDLIGLLPGTTYYAKTAAVQGSYSQTGFGPAASAATYNPSLSLNIRTVSQSLPPYTLSLGDLIPGSVISTTDQGQITISSNSASGAIVYITSTNSGLSSSLQGTTIDSVSPAGEDLSGLVQGYGARATEVSQSSGLMEISAPFDGTGHQVGPLDSQYRIIFTTNGAPIDNGLGRFEIQAKSSLSTPPATDYADIITIVAAPAF